MHCFHSLRRIGYSGHRALVIMVLVLLAMPNVVWALSCAPRMFTLNEAYDASNSIVVGLITECEEVVSSDAWAHGGRNCSFVSLEVLKDSNPASDYGGTASSGGCGLSLFIGHKYLLFLDSENRPLRYSVALSTNERANVLVDNQVRVLQEFRDGVVDDLADPWIFQEADRSCSVSHQVGGLSVSLSGKRAGVTEEQNKQWVREVDGDTTTVKGSATFGAQNSAVPTRELEMIIKGHVPEYPFDAPMLNVMLTEREPPPVRQAVIAVDGKSWLLYRTEQTLSMGGKRMSSHVRYLLGGTSAEEVFAAMETPADVVISATLLNAKDGALTPGVGLPTPEQNAYFGPVPEAARGTAQGESDGKTVQPYFGQVEPPAAVLRYETRSTQFPAAFKQFQQCRDQK